MTMIEQPQEQSEAALDRRSFFGTFFPAKSSRSYGSGKTPLAFGLLRLA
jgi:hypothetical protein